MKKKIVLFFSIICLSILTAINIQVALKTNQLLTLQQIEALASGETLPEVNVTCDTKGWGKCYRTEGWSPLNFCCKWDGSPAIACSWNPC